MIDIPTQEQWKEAFALSQRILDQIPWLYYPEELIFVLHDGERDEPLYATVHGHEEPMKGISIYKNEEEVSRYLTILENADNPRFETVIGNHTGVCMQTGDADLVTEADQYAIDVAEFEPKRTGGYVVFRKYEPGVMPWYADREDMEVAIEGLRLFGKVLDHPILSVPEGIALVTLHTDGSLVISDVPDYFKVTPPDVVKDDFYIARLKRLKRTGNSIEVESCYLPGPMEAPPGKPPFFPRIFMIGDVNMGYIVDQCMFNERAVSDMDFFTFLAEYFQKEGLPRKIRINKDNTGHLMRDLCKRLHIELEECDRLPIVSGFLDMLSGFVPVE